MELTRTTLQLRNSLKFKPLLEIVGEKNPYAMPDNNLLKLSEENIEL